jgi:hypothetical protein
LHVCNKGKHAILACFVKYVVAIGHCIGIFLALRDGLIASELFAANYGTQGKENNMTKISIAALLCLTLISCGGSDSDPEPVVPQNQSPVANAGTDQNVATTSVVTLDGSVSSDPDGDTLTYTWSLATKPADSNAQLSDSSVVSPMFVTDMNGSYVIELTVNDGTVTSALVSITVVAAAGDNVLTGVFVDSPVEGLRWASGNMQGMTDATGAFNYISGATVQFYVGDLLLGEATGSAVITPIDIVVGAQDINNTTVLNIVRFLLTLDDDNDASNGITITSASSALAIGDAIDFTQSIADFAGSSQIQNLITNITAVTNAGPRALVLEAVALNHFGDSIKDLLAGSYSGTFSGSNSGTWVGTLTTSGILSGTAQSSIETFAFVGVVNTNGSGNTDFESSGGLSDGTKFSGVFNVDGKASGIWDFFNQENGTWEGSKIN